MQWLEKPRTIAIVLKQQQQQQQQQQNDDSGKIARSGKIFIFPCPVNFYWPVYNNYY